MKLKKVLIFTVGVLFTFLLCEFTLRVFIIYGFNTRDVTKQPFGNIRNSKNIQSEEGFGIRDINSYGFYDKEYDLIDSTVRRGILLGNSFSEAVQVHTNQVFDNLLEDKLTKSGTKAQLLNFGHRNFHLLDELLIYKKCSRLAKHSIVLLQLNPHDLISPLASSQGSALCLENILDGSYQRQTTTPKNGKSFNFRSKSVAFNLMVFRQTLFQKFLSKSSSDAVEDENKNAGNMVTIFKGVTIREEAKVYFRKILRSIYIEAQQNNAKVVLFSYPPITDNPVAEIELAKTCSDIGIIYLDPKPEISKINAENRAMSGFINTTLGSGHLNKYGHQVLAEALCGKLASAFNP
jgi:hypothetical protein